jgi:hypothetical protein
MALEVLQRHDWRGGPKLLGDTFRLHKDRCGQQLEAACRLLTHSLGWELRLEIAGSLQRSQVCRSQDEVLDLSEHGKLPWWKRAGCECGPVAFLSRLERL